MMTRDEITRELKAIAEFDNLYLLEEEHTAEGMAGFRSRQERRRKLLDLAESQKSNSGVMDDPSHQGLASRAANSRS